MKKKLDEYSRVVIPSSYLKELGMEKGELLSVDLGDEKIEISKAKNNKTPSEEAIDIAMNYIDQVLLYDLSQIGTSPSYRLLYDDIEKLLGILKKGKKN